MSENDEFKARRERLYAELARQKVDLLAIAPTSNMRYLLGFAPRYDERLALMLITPAQMRLVIPRLNADQVEATTGMQTMRWRDQDGPLATLQQALKELEVEPGQVLAADDTMFASHLLMLQEVTRPSRAVAGDTVMSRLRMLKSPFELEQLARAAAQADRAIAAGAAACKVGATEREVAEVVAAYFKRDGADTADFAIIGSGANGAFPHHDTGERKLQKGDVVIMDIGATLNGYHSDVTRVVSIGEPSDEVRRAYALVRAANRAGRAAIRPGVRAKEVDAKTRAPILAAGLGEYFFHRTGHGLGIEIHEPPYISASSDTVLEPGMVFSVEPGMYFNGKFGIRIEDIVAVTEDGVRRLTGASHDLIVVPG